MNTTKKISLIRFFAILFTLPTIPMALYQFQSGDVLEALQSLGFVMAGVAFAIGPGAFVAEPDNPKTSLAQLSLAQKLLFLLAFVLYSLSFLNWYITGFAEIM